jgi:hypothetical protein
MPDILANIPTPEEVVQLAEMRQMNMGNDFQRMRQIRALMQGDIVLPLPELNKSETPAVANLMLQGMDQLARRTASVEPSLFFPSTRQGSDSAMDRSRDRMRVVQGWHKDNRMKRVLGKRARHFLAYATSPVVVKPDAKTKIPRWRVVNPLDCLPGSTDFDDIVPSNCIFASSHTYGSLLENYGPAVRALAKPPSWNWNDDYANMDMEFNVYEYIDSDVDMLVVAGYRDMNNYDNYSGMPALLLAAAPNLAHMPLVVMPGRICLDDQLQGHFDQIIGMYQTQAALMALTVIAQRRTVWPREWLVGRPNESPEIVSIPEPATGTPGVLEGGDLDTQTLDPSFRVLEIMDRLEEGMRKGAGVPAEFGGLSPTNIRTGRRGAQVMGATIDFTIAEAQDLLAEALVEENKIAMAIDKAYFPTKKTYQIATRSFAGDVNYTPSKLWETDKHIVDYPIAGADIQNLPIEGGQRLAMGTLSREGFMEIDPLIKDPRAEIQRMDREGVKTAWFGGLQQILSIPDAAMQLTDIIAMDKKMAGGLELYQAFDEVQKEAQERQATPAPPGDPATQPGVAQPGQGVEQPETIPEIDPSMNRMTQLLGSLGTAQTAQKFRGNN